MSTSATIRSAWNTQVLQHATVQAMTTSILDDEFTTGTKKELSRLKFGQQIHFIQFVVTRIEIPGLIGARQYRYRVELSYFIEADTDGANHTTAIDNMDTIHGLIQSELGEDWNNTIDLTEDLDESIQREQIDIEGKAVWKFTRNYSGIEIV